MDLIDVYKSTDLLLVPSKTDNSPNVVFEAALCGTPFLGSNKAGLPELSELFGFKTFEYGNSENLFMRIIEAKHFNHDREMIRRTALESVDPRKIAETLRVLYQAKITEEASRRSGKVL
jgi:glycosyltransferase involved in cell wall biosynthesis